MEAQLTTDRLTEPMTLPETLWARLTEIQKESVRQTLLQVCQQLVAQWQAEVTNEPECDHP